MRRLDTRQNQLNGVLLPEFQAFVIVPLTIVIGLISLLVISGI